jgi:4-alpha-glucanotransferase
MTSPIDRLARLRGIGDAYHDYRGDLHHFSAATKSEILRSMGYSVDAADVLSLQTGQLETQQLSRLLPPVASSSGSGGIEVNIGARDFGAALTWRVILEGGESRAGALSTAILPELWRGQVQGAWITRRLLELPVHLPFGYHELQASLASGVVQRCALIVAPPECHQLVLPGARRGLWGVALQLYTLRTRDNWGIGDFADLKGAIRWLAPCGAGFLGVNPLHALAPAEPQRCSPYSASNRHFLNILYISVAAVAEYAACAAARACVEDPKFAARLQQLRAAERVDYPGVAAAKLGVLKLLHRHFQGCLTAQSVRAIAYRQFIQDGGESLRLHAIFDALDAHLSLTRGTAAGWQNWPREYRDPHSPAVALFAAGHRDDVEFFLYAQWLAHEQLSEAQELARELGMPIGLYGDYAVGAHPSGSETWIDQSSYCLNAEIGAPPDPLALKGQGWGIPPQDPAALEAHGIQQFVSLVQKNMRYFGALRLDHVMSLFRQWWVPRGFSPDGGAYVHYPMDKLMAALSLESQRESCLIVGEDLGVVPNEIRAAMPKYGLYHYKVLLFEKQGERFKSPQEYERRALATVTTHDMPTLRSYWESRDIALREELSLYPSPELREAVGRERESDRRALLAALGAENLHPARPANSTEDYSPELARAVHLYLARSNSLLTAIQIEDLLDMIDPVNVPGTDWQYPNWQRKLNADLEDIAERGDLRAQFDDIDRARRQVP